MTPENPPADAGRTRRIAVIPGDGIGTEVATAAVGVLETAARAFDLSLEFVWFDLGAEKYLREGVTLPDAVFEDLRDHYDAIFLGALGDPRVPDLRHARDILLGLRTRLDLYINLRPVKLMHPDLTPLKGKGPEDLDFVIFRENTEGLYVGVGGTFKQDTPDEIAVNEMINTRKGVERIIRAAFEYAEARGLKRVCMADKANVLTHAHGLWQRVFKLVRAEYPHIASRHLYADVAAMELVRAPEDFDVIVTSNMFGDLLSDLAAQLVGGLGLAPSGNVHPGRAGLFEPVHGSAPPLAGKDVANPFAMILTGAQMLDWLGFTAAADAIEGAVRAALAAGEATVDLGGRLGTRAAGEAVAGRLGRAHP
ncbi:MAG: isocitrate/isopropylmalate dehydrogenase family protein [bacterium]